MIGYAMCGSYCTHKDSLDALKKLKLKYTDILPIISENAASTDTRFGKCEDLLTNVTTICEKEPILSIKDAEPIGPKIKLDALVISPCTGNTLAKIAHGITDTTVTMAAKAHVRNNRPIILALASNDALGANLSNIGELMNRKNIYFVPMFEDDPVKKPNSLVADFNMLTQAVDAALDSVQLRPVIKL